MKGSLNERENEVWARHVVSSVLGVPVDRFEDGTANSQVDAIVRYPDRIAALEVVADHDADFNAQWEALERLRHQLEVPGLRQGWVVRLQPTARVNQIRRVLPALLLAWQDDPPSSWSRPARRVEFDRLGILSARPIERRPGGAFLFAKGFWGFAGDERTVGAWTTWMLSTHDDVPRKLAAHPGAAERHAFLWATVANAGVQLQLDPDGANPFPVMRPTLPAGVSHVWVADWPQRRGAIAWFPDRGWWRTPWPLATEGEELGARVLGDTGAESSTDMA